MTPSNDAGRADAGRADAGPAGAGRSDASPAGIRRSDASPADTGHHDTAHSTDTDQPLAPADMLALLQNQQRSIQTQMGGFVPAITAAWGAAWLIGFLALFAIDGLRPNYALPLPVAVTIFTICTVVAIGLSAWLGVRSSRGIRPSAHSAFTGTVYGITWSVGALSIVVFAQGMTFNGMSPELANFFYPTAYVLFTGIMYIIAGAIWHAVPSIVEGGVLIVISLVAIFLPYPVHYLFFALAGGGAFLILALVAWLYIRRVQRTVGLVSAHV